MDTRLKTKLSKMKAQAKKDRVVVVAAFNRNSGMSRQEWHEAYMDIVETIHPLMALRDEASLIYDRLPAD